MMTAAEAPAPQPLGQAGVARKIGHDPVEVLARADHRPEMPGNVGILELGERRLGDHLQRFAGGIGNQMEMQSPCPV